MMAKTKNHGVECLTIVDGPTARYVRPLSEAEGGLKSISVVSLGESSLVLGARRLVQLVSS